MKVDCVFSGGGVKAYAFIGALQSIEQNNLELVRLSGTSAGAIIASFIAAQYKTKEIQQLIHELDLKQFLDPPLLTKYIPFSKWIFLFFQMGLYRGNRFEKWLYKKLAEKGIYTFADLKSDHLKVIVSDLTLGKLVVLPDDLERLYNVNPMYFPVSTAVRMSAGFPYFFMPKKLKGINNESSIIVDGGLLSNFPLWVFETKEGGEKRPVLGVKLSESIEKTEPRNIKNAFHMYHALFSTMKLAHDAKYVSEKTSKNIIFIPVNNIQAVDFSIESESISELIKIGKQKSDRFLKYWPT